MSGKAGALAFLVLRTGRNRLARQVARVKSPRYALALLFGLAYFWLVFFRPVFARGGAAPPSLTGFSSTLGSIAGVGFAITVILWWLLGGVANALAYQPAEVQMLFAAPLSRRQLLAYRIARSQMQLLFGALIWTVLIRRWGVTIAPPLRFFTAWGFFTVLSLHRLGAALVQNEPVTGARRLGLWAGKGLAAAAALAILAGVVPPFLHITPDHIFDAFRNAGLALNAPPASYALAPFRAAIAPLYAPSLSAWIPAFGVVAGLVALHVAWVLSMTAPFEEAAATASAEMAKRIAAMRERRSTGGVIRSPGKTARQWLPLAPVGRPAVAIVWKNTLALVRTGVVRSLLIVVIILFGGSAFARMARSAQWGAGLAAAMAGFAVMLLVVGARTVRNDLRQDLLNLPLLKTYPLTGTTMVASQIASPVLVLTAFQTVLCVLAWFAAPPQFRTAAASVNAVVAAVLVLFTLLTFNVVAVGIQNAAALLFPAWVRLGGQAGGVEVIGQALLLTIGSLLTQVLLFVLPAVVGVALYFATRHALGASAFLAAGGAGVVVLGAECVAFVIVLGDVFDKLDPNALNPV